MQRLTLGGDALEAVALRHVTPRPSGESRRSGALELELMARDGQVTLELVPRAAGLSRAQIGLRDGVSLTVTQLVLP